MKFQKPPVLTKKLAEPKSLPPNFPKIPNKKSSSINEKTTEKSEEKTQKDKNNIENLNIEGN
jgi:hypothetical protein